MNPSSASEMRPYECNQKHHCFSAMEPGLSLAGDWEAPEEEEEKEEEEESSQFLNVHMRRPRTLRGSSHTYDSFRRHSWEPGKVLEEDTDFDQRSLSLKELAPDGLDSTEQLDGHSLGRGDPRRAPIIHSSNEMGSLLSQDEEEEDGQGMSQDCGKRKQAYGLSPSSPCGHLPKSASMSVIDSFPDANGFSLYGDNISLISRFSSGSCGQLDTSTVEAEDQEHWQKEGNALGRTLSFFKKMTGKSKNKEKERMKEGKDKDARYTNGHLFTSITVSGMTMCYACNKSITAKEALICPSE
ncbi:A-kinase anchor protein 13-like [Thamnophis elegans]|uniref:A-kinase anchor protein 13-like n=1 Tax=Thamnophis elegans TaxID=35005 RepID=UPI001376C068|nr:A-kinase anchor protein 13-like [Thamnophis elegans]